MQRRLAAILSADVAGYSRLVGQDEETTIAALREHQAAVLPLIAEHGGRVIDMAGDGFLAEFPSVVGAVRSALAIQAAIAARNEGVSAACRLEYRIGVNQGEIVVEGERVYGDGINVAARLQASADPGGIAISGRVYEDVVGKLDAAWRDRGDQAFKNIARPVRMYDLPSPARPSADDPTPTSPASASPALPGKPSIAVLPFDNLSGPSDDAIFSDGITEEIITGLAKFPSLFVVARNSSFAFRGEKISVPEIARRLGVAYVLEGSVRRSSKRVRVTAQLIEAATGAHVWAERYDREIEDLFDVQDEVARTIAATLFGRIEEDAFRRSLSKPPASLAAYDYVLRGLVHFRGYEADANAQALAMFEKAVAADPRYGLAHAYCALAHVGVHGLVMAPREVLEAALARAQRAIEFDPQEARCQRVVAVISLFLRDYEAAEHHARRTTQLNPNFADGCSMMAHVLAQRGRAEEALAWMDTAVRLNPFHPDFYHHTRGLALYSLRRFAEAAQTYRLLPSPGPSYRARLAACYGMLGDTDRAREQVAAILAARPDFSSASYMERGVLLEQQADRELLLEGLLKAGLPE